MTGNEEEGREEEDEEDLLGRNDELCLNCAVMPCVCLLATLENKIELLKLELKIKHLVEEKEKADKKVAENAAKKPERAENQLQDKSLTQTRAAEIAKPPPPPPLTQETTKSFKSLAMNTETSLPPLSQAITRERLPKQVSLKPSNPSSSSPNLP